jgi:hemoglobin
MNGGSMRAMHKGLGISNQDFNGLVQDLGKSSNEFKVPARNLKASVALLAQMRRH